MILLFGFVYGYFMYELFRYRAGGVIAIPILVIYTLEFPIALPIFIYSVAMCYLIGFIITERTLIYGRRLLYLYLTTSLLITSVAFYFVLYYLNLNLLTITVGAIFPGLIAHNISRDAYSLKAGGIIVLMMVWHFIIIVMFGITILLASGWRP
jgi:hypothetical protein